jgi:hypothetical protein
LYDHLSAIDGELAVLAPCINRLPHLDVVALPDENLPQGLE